MDNNGNVFAVTARTAATAPTIPISYKTSIRGTAGEDGDSVFIRYSASSNGANMTAAPAADTHYIGFYLGQSASNTASDYTWSQYVGKEISEVAIDEFSFVITYDDGTTSTAPLNTENCLLTYAVPSDEATAMTAYLVPSNADLNTYRGENYWGKTFYAGGNNTVQNIPIAGTAFSLEVLRSGAFATTQRITIMAEGLNNQPTVYTRSVADSTGTSADGTWTAWTEVAEANGTYPDMTVGKAQALAKTATVATAINSAQYGWWRFARLPFSTLTAMTGTGSYSAILLVNSINPAGIDSAGAIQSGLIELDLRLDGGEPTSIGTNAVMKVLCGGLSPDMFCRTVSDTEIEFYVNLNAAYNRRSFTVLDEGYYDGRHIDALEFESTFVSSSAPSGAVYAVVRNVASELTEGGHRTLLWRGTCSSGSSISVSGLSNYSALYIKANSDSAEEYVMLTKGAVGLYPSLYSGNKMTIVPGVDTYWFVELFNISVSGSTATFNFDLLTLDISSTTIQKQQQSAAITLTEIYGIEAFKIS